MNRYKLSRENVFQDQPSNKETSCIVCVFCAVGGRGGPAVGGTERVGRHRGQHGVGGDGAGRHQDSHDLHLVQGARVLCYCFLQAVQIA